MKEDGLRRRWFQEPAAEGKIKAKRTHPRRQIRGSKVVATMATKRLADEKDDVHHRLQALWGAIGRCIADANRLARYNLAIAVDHATRDAGVVRNKASGEALRGSKIE